MSVEKASKIIGFRNGLVEHLFSEPVLTQLRTTTGAVESVVMHHLIDAYRMHTPPVQRSTSHRDIIMGVSGGPFDVALANKIIESAKLSISKHR